MNEVVLYIKGMFDVKDLGQKIIGMVDMGNVTIHVYRPLDKDQHRKIMEASWELLKFLEENLPQHDYTQLKLLSMDIEIKIFTFNVIPENTEGE